MYICVAKRWLSQIRLSIYVTAIDAVTVFTAMKYSIILFSALLFALLSPNDLNDTTQEETIKLSEANQIIRIYKGRVYHFERIDNGLELLSVRYAD